jgi:hypothetical protein
MSSNSSLRDAESHNSTCRINEHLPGKKVKMCPCARPSGMQYEKDALAETPKTKGTQSLDMPNGRARLN